MLLKTLSPKNEFRFACPVFGAEVGIAGCISLRDQYARGQRPAERKGCQACLAASKCPIVRMLQTIHRTGEDPGLFSAEPKVGTLPGDILDHIHPIVVNEHLLDGFGVPQSERDIILAGNERTSSGKARVKAKPQPIALEEVKARREKPDAAEHAAVTGDMSAAISAAVKREAAASPEKATERQEPVAAPVAPKVAPTPPAATPAPSTPGDLAKSLPAAKPKLSLLEIARQRAAGRAA